MAEDLDDAQFWLPSHFLTDDDILHDFASTSISDRSSTATESSDDDDHLLLSGCPRHSSLHCPFRSKGSLLSTSPQSTLCGCDCNHQGSGSSLGSPNGPTSPQKAEAKDVDSDKGDNNNEDGVQNKDMMKKKSDNGTLDLLNKAAGEVAKIKMRSESGRTTVGTGFFDCSNTIMPSTAAATAAATTTSYSSTSHPLPPLFFSPTLPPLRSHDWGPLQFPPPQPQLQQSKVTKTSSPNNNSNGRPLGLPPSAWPALPGQPQGQPPQVQAQTQRPMPMMGMYVGQPGQKGTGVFLPRRVATTAEPKKKSDGNGTKTKSGKGSQRRKSRTPKAIEDDIQLPPEWVY